MAADPAERTLDQKGRSDWDGLILTGWLPADYSPGKGAIPT